jgi:hypothetical protein
MNKKHLFLKILVLIVFIILTTLIVLYREGVMVLDNPFENSGVIYVNKDDASKFFFTSSPSDMNFITNFIEGEGESFVPPYTHVQLYTLEQVYDVGKYDGPCSVNDQIHDGSLYQKNSSESFLNNPEGIPGLLCWWAGSGYEIVVNKDVSTGGYELLHREIDSGSEEYEGYIGRFIKIRLN